MKKSETARFIAVIDPKASVDSGFRYKALNAPGLIGAMNEAAKLIDDDTYLVSIFQRDYHSGEKEKMPYKRVLTNRGSGWRTNEDGESEATFNFWYKWHDGNKPITACDIDWTI